MEPNPVAEARIHGEDPRDVEDGAGDVRVGHGVRSGVDPLGGRLPRGPAIEVAHCRWVNGHADRRPADMEVTLVREPSS